MIFVPRLHPKLPDDDKRALRRLSLHKKTNVVMAHDLDMDFLTVASDINIGGWGSTKMYTSTMFDIPAVMCLFPDDRERRLANGYPDGEPPLLLAKAGWGPESPEELVETLTYILKNYEEATERVRTNGSAFKKLLELGAEKRIAEVVLDFL